MCRSAFYNDKWISNVGELSAAIAPHRPIFCEGGEPQSADECLCHLDFRATARLVGCIACQSEGDDPMDIWILPPVKVVGPFFELDSE